MRSHVTLYVTIWKDPHASPELKELMRESAALIAYSSRGMRGGEASGKGQLPQ